MKLYQSRVCMSLIAALTIFGCKKSTSAPEKSAAPQGPAPQVAPVAPGTEGVCVGPIASGETTKVKIGGQTWEKSGSTLRWADGSKAKALTVGLVSDIKEDSEDNKANLQQIHDWFKTQKVDMIINVGDTGENANQIVNALSILAELPVPLFNIMGNRESQADYAKAMKTLAAKFSNVFDLSVVRRVATPFADFVSMPGYYDAKYIHAAGGCQYHQADLDAIQAAVKDATVPVVLVSHGPPKMTGEQGLDLTPDKGHVGDPALAATIQADKIAFGIFGHIHEAGGHATDLTGEKKFDANKPYESFYMNPGPADALKWKLNDKSDSYGMAGVVVFASGKAHYNIHRLKPAAKKKAKK